MVACNAAPQNFTVHMPALWGCWASPSSPCFTLNIKAKRNDGSLISEGQIRDKSCQVTLDTRASVTIFRPYITTGPPREN
jgi:hypothetical protein